MTTDEQPKSCGACHHWKVFRGQCERGMCQCVARNPNIARENNSMPRWAGSNCLKYEPYMEYTIKDAVVIKWTDKALLVEAPDLDGMEWIPHSVITENSEVWRSGQEGELIVGHWWARKKGWI